MDSIMEEWWLLNATVQSHLCTPSSLMPESPARTVTRKNKIKRCPAGRPFKSALGKVLPTMACAFYVHPHASSYECLQMLSRPSPALLHGFLFKACYYGHNGFSPFSYNCTCIFWLRSGAELSDFVGVGFSEVSQTDSNKTRLSTVEPAEVTDLLVRAQWLHF